MSFTAFASGGGGSLMDPNSWSSAVDKDITSTYGRQSSTVNMGGGDVTALRDILAQMQQSTNAEGMDALIKNIFKLGFEENMPGMLGATNNAGVRPSSSSTQGLLQNDLIARLAGASQQALSQQQSAAAQVAAALAGLTEKPIVTTVQGEGKSSGGTNRFDMLARGIGSNNGGLSGLF